MPDPGDDESADDEPSPSDDEEDASDRPGDERESAESPRRDDDGEGDSRTAEGAPDDSPARPAGPSDSHSWDGNPDEGTESGSPPRQSRRGDDEFRGDAPPERSRPRPSTRDNSRRGDQPGREEWRRDPHGRGPRPEGAGDDSPSDWRLFAYDVVSSVLAVAVIGAYLFAVSGVWPPLVAVESGSMKPNMQVNDLVFVMEEGRFSGPGAHPSGVVTARAGEEVDYTQFDNYGDVIVYHPDGNEKTTPIIHRAMFWVEEGDNWCRQGDRSYLGGMEVGSDRCIADHAGFITKGDNNNRYDQAQGLSGPVKPEWVVGTAEVRVPGLGWIRLRSAG